MKKFCVAFLLAASCACSSPPPLPRPSPPPIALAASPEVEKPLILAEPSPTSAPKVSSSTHGKTLFEGVSFDSRTHRLVVIDQPRGPGTEFADAASAARSARGIAAINAGFFTPEGSPLGIVISSGNKAGAWNRASSLGSGVWCEDRSGKAMILRREALGADRAGQMRELLQAGPMLISNSVRVTGLDATKSSIRTIILWDGQHRWWIGRTSPCTLAEISAQLAASSPAGWNIRHALNLDGGRSSELWASPNIAGGPLVRRPAWNRPVRNFLVLKTR